MLTKLGSLLESLHESVLDDSKVKSLLDDLKNQAKIVLLDDWGFRSFDDSGVKIDAKDEDGVLKIYVTCEFTYRDAVTLMDALNPVLQEYCPDSYFDAEDSGRWFAIVDKDCLK